MLPIDTKEFFSRLTAEGGPDSTLYQAILDEMRRVAARYIPRELRYQASLTDIVAEGVQQAVMGLREKGPSLVDDDRKRFLKLLKTTVSCRAKDYFRKAIAQSRNQNSEARPISDHSYAELIAGGADPAKQAAAKELLEFIAIELMRYEPPARRMACFLGLFGQLNVAGICKLLREHEESLRAIDPQAAKLFQAPKSPNTVKRWLELAMEMINAKFGPLEE